MNYTGRLAGRAEIAYDRYVESRITFAVVEDKLKREHGAFSYNEEPGSNYKTSDGKMLHVGTFEGPQGRLSLTSGEVERYMDALSEQRLRKQELAAALHGLPDRNRRDFFEQAERESKAKFQGIASTCIPRI